MSLAEELACSLITNEPYQAPNAAKRPAEAVIVLPGDAIRRSRGDAMTIVEAIIAEHGPIYAEALGGKALASGVNYNSVRSAVCRLRRAGRILTELTTHGRRYSAVKR